MSPVRLTLLASLVLACNTDSADSRGATSGVSSVASMNTNTNMTGTDTGVTSAATEAITTSGPGATSHSSIISGEPTTEEPLNTTGLVATSEDPPPSVALPPPPPEGDYAAQIIPGDPTFLSVRKADKDHDTCTTINFLSPADGGPLEYDVTLPAMWFVEGALIHQGAADCLSFDGFPGEPVMAYSGNGSATWAGACPATIAIDLTLAFQQEQPWVPVESLLQEPAVPTSGC